MDIKERNEKIKALYVQGYSIKAIGKKFFLTEGTVYNIAVDRKGKKKRK